MLGMNLVTVRVGVIAVLITATTGLRGQESICDLFSHLDAADGHPIVVTGDLIVSKNLAVLGAATCDHFYITQHQMWPIALSLRASSAVTSAQLKQFQDAQDETDRIRKAGNTVRASASFSGRVRLGSAGPFAGELIFDSFENLKVEALPEPSSLTVVPICDLFQNLRAWDGKRIAVRGEFVATDEGAWISGRCKGGFYTDTYRWPVLLWFAYPAYYWGGESAKLVEPTWPSMPSKGEELSDDHFNGDLIHTATFVGTLHLRSEYHVRCLQNGVRLGNGFGHLSGAAAELNVDNVVNLVLTVRTPADDISVDDDEKCPEAAR